MRVCVRLHSDYGRLAHKISWQHDACVVTPVLVLKQTLMCGAGGARAYCGGPAAPAAAPTGAAAAAAVGR